MDGKYPYYAFNIPDKGNYTIIEKTDEKIVLDNNEPILINPPKDSIDNIKNSISIYLKEKYNEDIENIRLLFLNIESRKNYIKLSKELDDILNALDTTNDINSLIDKFKLINNEIINNNNNYLSNIQNITDKKNNLENYIKNNEKSLDIINNGCKFITTKKYELYLDKENKVYIKYNKENKYIDSDKKFKKIKLFINECIKIKNFKQKKQNLKYLSLKKKEENKEDKLNRQLDKLNNLIPNINRISVKLQFYENDKMNKNNLIASLINQNLKIKVIEYITNYLEELENIYFIKESKILIHDKSNFINNLIKYDKSPFSFNTINKGDVPFNVKYEGNQLIINNITIEFDEYKKIFIEKMEYLKNKLKILIDDLKIENNSNTFKLLDDIYCYKINYNNFKINYNYTNFYNGSNEPYIEMITKNNWYANETLLKKNDKDYSINATIYQIQTIKDEKINNYLIIVSSESQIFYYYNKYNKYIDNTISNNTIDSLKQIGNTFKLDSNHHCEIIGYSLDNNRSELIRFDSNIFVVDILFIFRGKNTTIKINDKELINENNNYYIVNREILHKDPNKLFSDFKINETLNRKGNKYIKTSDSNSNSTNSTISKNIAAKVTEEIIDENI